MQINNPTSFSPPDLTLSTSNSSGNAGALRADDTILVYDTTVPTNVGANDSAATGSAAVSARRDHVHGGAAVFAAATQAQMEAASSTSTTVTPGRTVYHPGVAKCWVDVAADGSNNASYNVSGVSKDATGQYTVTIDTDFSSANYAIIQGVASSASSPRKVSVLSQAAGTFSYDIYTEGTSKVDMEAYSACFGDQ